MTFKIRLNKAIKAINPSAQFSITNEDFSTIKWIDGTEPISQSDVEAKQAELQADSDAKEYQTKRKEEYPSIGDQLDYIYHNGLTKWKADMITPVKEKYPKPD
jgi:hypothetical protein